MNRNWAPTTNPVHRQQVQESLELVLASDSFRDSPRLSRFLRHLVEASMNGSAGNLKEYSIGIDVFDKPLSFDPRTDSTVRGEAGKLRLKLRLYYENEGRNDPLLITIPKGNYSAHFQRTRVSRNTYLTVAAAAVALVLILTWANSPPSLNPRLPELRRITNDTGLTAYPALSPGGDLVAYASDRASLGDLDIWIQPIAGLEARRLTDHPANDLDPVFSPDGATIAFRSDRDGGGIYVISSVGGTPRRIAEGGHRPRYSPDGAWIAYTIGTWRFLASTPGSGKVFIVPARGGDPRQFQPQFSSAHYPVWSTDGRQILFLGRSHASVPAKESFDWWVAPANGGNAVKTGALPEFGRLKLYPSTFPRVAWIPWYWSGNSVVFSAQSNDAVNLWQVPISGQTGKVAAEPTRLTFGTGQEATASSTSGNLIAFGDWKSNVDIWSVPLAPARGPDGGRPERLTQSPMTDSWPSISRDGKTLAFFSDQAHSHEIWTKALPSGPETQVSYDGEWKDWPEISPDGSSYTYALGRPGRRLMRSGFNDAPRETICEGCQTPSFLPDGGGFLHTNLHPPVHILFRNRGASASTVYLRHPKWELQQVMLSPDARWIVFYAILTQEHTRIFVAPFRKDRPPPEPEWVALADGESHDVTPAWSAAGNKVYFVSNRDGFSCIWSVPFNPKTKSAGSPMAVAHFHDSALRLHNTGVSRRGMSVAHDRIVFPLEQIAGNIWLMR